MTEHFTYRIEQDQFGESPRDWDNLGTMICWHGRMDLGDETISQDNAEDVLNEWLKEPSIFLPLYIYDHSGITMRTTPFSCPWDSGQVGYIYVTLDKIRAEYGWKRITAKRRALIEKYLRQEVETYDQFLTGDVWGYIVEDEHGDVADSCWGFFGYDYTKEEAELAVKCLEKDYETEHWERVLA